MKLFPKKTYTIELKDDMAYALKKLGYSTRVSHSLTSDRIAEPFKGQITKNGFNVILSKPGRFMCVFNGNFEGRKGKIEVTSHKAFKAMSSFLMLQPVILAVISLFSDEFYVLTLIPILGLSFILVRFVFIELSFRYVLKRGLGLLKLNLGIESLKEV